MRLPDESPSRFKLALAAWNGTNAHFSGAFVLRDHKLSDGIALLAGATDNQPTAPAAWISAHVLVRYHSAKPHGTVRSSLRVLRSEERLHLEVMKLCRTTTRAHQLAAFDSWTHQDYLGINPESAIRRKKLPSHLTCGWTR
jgi:hypothetical protein